MDRLLGLLLCACLILIHPAVANAAVTDALIQAGFTCVGATDSTGAAIGGTMCEHPAFSTPSFTLDEALAVFVPSTTTTAVQHVVLYFQGFRGVCGDTSTDPAGVMSIFDLAEQMQNDSSPDSVLVFPMSIGDDNTYYNDFAASAGPFGGFLAWIESIVSTNHWSIAGHSGAGDVIAKSLNLNPSTIPKFAAIELLDAAYNMSETSEVALWQTIAQANPTLALTCIGNGTYTGCQTLAAQAGFKTPVALTQTATAHCDIPNTYFGPWLKSSGQ